MRHFFIALITVSVLTDTSIALAGTADCATIDDVDSRMLCFAVATGMESYCSFIKDSDKRTYCRSIVRVQR